MVNCKYLSIYFLIHSQSYTEAFHPRRFEIKHLIPSLAQVCVSKETRTNLGQVLTSPDDLIAQRSQVTLCHPERGTHSGISAPSRLPQRSPRGPERAGLHPRLPPCSARTHRHPEAGKAAPRPHSVPESAAPSAPGAEAAQPRDVPGCPVGRGLSTPHKPAPPQERFLGRLWAPRLLLPWGLAAAGLIHHIGRG